MPCFYCGTRLRKSGPAMRTKDHVVPKSKGGVKTVDSCFRCNQKKADLPLDEFRKLCGGIEFWGEQTARVEKEKTDWIWEFDAKKKTMTPVEYERVITPRPLTIRYSKPAPKPKPVATGKNSRLPNTLPNLRGCKFGSFTVTRWLPEEGRWEVFCRCGAEEVRTTRAIRNPLNNWDSCTECRKIFSKLRNDLYRLGVGDYSQEECFHVLYDTVLMETSIPSGQVRRILEEGRIAMVSDRKILEQILNELHFIRHKLCSPHSISIQFEGDNTMPVTLIVGQTVTATPVEKDAAGAVVTSLDPTSIAWTSSDPAVASGSVDNPDGSVTFTALAVGTTTVTVTDPANGLTASDTITVTLPPATSIAIEFGTPAGV